MTPELIGVGSPLVDLLLRVDDDFVTNHAGGGKGGMQMVEAPLIADLVSWSGKLPVRAPGGASANTTVGTSNLGISAAFLGCCGSDDLAQFYRDSLTSQGCGDRLIGVDAPTGRVLSLITPDAQRTMRTCLGAAAQLSTAHVGPEAFAGAKVAMIEGYLLFNHDLARAAIRGAKAAGCAVALDFASFEVVKYNKDVIAELLPSVDILFANEDEAAAWNGDGPEAALADLASRVAIAAVKLGKDGAWIRRGTETVRVQADAVEAVDTTGAGDCWAAGFLAAWLRGLDLTRCGRIAALSGAAAVQVVGAQPPRDAWLRIKGYLDAWT